MGLSRERGRVEEGEDLRPHTQSDPELSADSGSHWGGVVAGAQHLTPLCPQSCRAYCVQHFSLLSLYLLWGAMVSMNRGRVVEKHSEAPQYVLGSSTEGVQMFKPITAHQNPASPGASRRPLWIVRCLLTPSLLLPGHDSPGSSGFLYPQCGPRGPPPPGALDLSRQAM